MVLRSRLLTTNSMETIEFRQDDIVNHSRRHNLAHKVSWEDKQRALGACPQVAVTELLLFGGRGEVQKGGLQCGDESILVKQRSVVRELMAQLGHNIIKGKNLTSISLPVKMFEPRSFLQKVTDTMVYFPEYASKAAKADPEEVLWPERRERERERDSLR